MGRQPTSSGSGGARTRHQVPATYGDCAESAAEALSGLLVLDYIPADDALTERLLDCRQAVVDALRQRLRGLGLNGDLLSTKARLPERLLCLNGLDHRMALMVEAIAAELPTLSSDDRRRPIDVLGQPVADRAVECWRRAAVELLAGSHALDSTDHQPWLTEPGAAWYLMRDLAAALEAVLILDDRLTEVGLMTKHDTLVPSMELDSKRMILGHLGRVATWSATSDSPDHAFPRLHSERVEGGPVVLVTAPPHLAAAQRRLADLLRPVHAADAFYTGDPEITADTARMLVANQLFLTGLFAQLAERAPAAINLRPHFEARREILAEITPRLRHLIDHQPAEDRAYRWSQQTEITTAIRRLRRNHAEFALTPGQLVDLANATHEVTRNLAITLRRELQRENTNLRIDDPTQTIGPTRVVRGTRLSVSLTDLAHQPPPTPPAVRLGRPEKRAALRQTLEVTATRTLAPGPYPLRRPQREPQTPPR